MNNTYFKAETNRFVPIFLFLLCAFTLQATEIKKINVADNGKVEGSGPLGKWYLMTSIEGAMSEEAKITRENDIKIIVQRKVKAVNGESCNIHEEFIHEDNGIRWEIEITGESDLPWSVPITATLGFDVTDNRTPVKTFWAAWDKPADSEDMLGDPLRPSKIVSKVYTYGAPRFKTDRTLFPWYSWGQRPRGENYISLPLFTLLESKIGGLTLAASPERLLLDMELVIDEKGSASFIFYRHRISKENTIRLTLFLTEHADDWRAGLGWMNKKFEPFFNSPNPNLGSLSGTAVYSSYRGKIDAEELKSMAFAFNWRASVNFPYPGMFLPPVALNEEWPRLRYLSQKMGSDNGTISMKDMDENSEEMDKSGFKVLEYFNTTEFGQGIQYPPGTELSETEHNVWKDADWRNPNEFLYSRLAAAIMRVPVNLPLEGVKWPPDWSKTKPGGLYYTWEQSVAMDPGEPVYRDYLLEQAQRHIDSLPHSSGICIDRMDWLRLYNVERDDRASWFDGKPARSLVWSWIHLMDRMGPLMRNSGKAIFVSPIVKRLELMKYVDGFLCETDDENGGMNGIAVLGMNKPTVIWRGNRLPKGKEDNYFQRRLHLGLFTMCPYPENDHGVRWEPAEGRQPWVDYGLMMAALKGKKWVLESHCIQVSGDDAQANLFEVEGGWAAPITLGKSDKVKVQIRNVPFLSGKIKVEVLHPGVKQPLLVQSRIKNEVAEIVVPLIRGCAMIRISKK